ncbi:broad substrate specificity ATP-binding cassette transporter ABCG2-like [Urocitellus parryii]
MGLCLVPEVLATSNSELSSPAPAQEWTSVSAWPQANGRGGVIPEKGSAGLQPLSRVHTERQKLQRSFSHYQIFIPESQRNTSGVPKMVSVDPNLFTQGTLLSIHNICYHQEEVKSNFLLCRRETFQREILTNINGIMKPGLNAIMECTGVSKSFLLDVLAARKDPSGLSGDILINGAPGPANFKYNSGFVVQDDLVLGTLMVRENLAFSAALRLPTTMKKHEKDKRIKMVIDELGLDKVADSKYIDTQFVRGIAGEEIKRTSIAMGLITDPSILFLNEPTAGLDWSTANGIFSLLKKTEQGNQYIPISGAGYHCELYNNPSDFFMDVINGDSSPVIGNRKKVYEGLKRGITAFLITMITALMVTYSATSMILAIGIHKNAASGKTLLVTSYFVFMLVFLGMSLNFETMAPQLSWLQYFSIPHYGYMALQYNEFLEQNFCSGHNTTVSKGCSSNVMEVTGAKGIVQVHVPFPLQDLSQIEKYLGSFSDDSSTYIKEFQYLSQAYDLTWHDVYVVLSSTLTP